jgi:hypothetical protein
MPTLTFKVSAEEERQIRARAKAHAKSVSEYLRRVALPGEKRPRRRLVLKKHRVSGLLYDATPGPPVTQARIDAALNDFP